MSSSSKTPLSLREGSTVVALALFIPMAIQGVLLAVLWNLAQWGSLPNRIIEGVTFNAGSTLTLGVAIIVVLIIRYVVLAGYWLLVTEKFGQPRRRAFLAALPIAGLWWSLQVSSTISRDDARPMRLTPEFTAITVGFTALSLFLLPMSMQVATAAEEGELERLAAPCSDLFPGTTAEEPVVAVGEQGLSRAAFDALVNEVVAGQRGAVAQIRDDWPVKVADQQVRMLLWEQSALDISVSATVADMESQIEDWELEFGGPEDLRQIGLEVGLPPSQWSRYACASQLTSQFADVYPFVETADGSTEYEDALRAAARQLKVQVDPTIGYWDPTTLSVVAEEPVSLDAQPAEETTEVETEPAPRTFAARVEYDIQSIPTQEFQDSLTWQADICAGATELLQDRFLDRVTLYERLGGRWVRVTDAQARAERGGRCSGGQVNLFIGSSELEPPANWTDQGWRTCREYQVRIPETPTFQAANVDMCVSTRADTAEGGV